MDAPRIVARSLGRSCPEDVASSVHGRCPMERQSLKQVGSADDGEDEDTPAWSTVVIGVLGNTCRSYKPRAAGASTAFIHLYVTATLGSEVSREWMPPHLIASYLASCSFYADLVWCRALVGAWQPILRPGLPHLAHRRRRRGYPHCRRRYRACDTGAPINASCLSRLRGCDHRCHRHHLSPDGVGRPDATHH